jgi:hypothetical protein
MKNIITTLLTCAALSTSATASFQGDLVPHDDLVNHLTNWGPARIPHIAVDEGEIIAGSSIYYNSELRDFPLALRPQGRLIKYICPALPGVSGMDKSRSMGVSPEFLVDRMPTRIKLLNPTTPNYYVGTDIPVTPGLYYPQGTKTVSSHIENGLRINRNILECSSRQKDGLKAVIEFEEAYHYIERSFDINAGAVQLANPATANNQRLTFSCWYKPLPAGRNNTTLPLFSIQYMATENGLENQFKTIMLGVHSVKDAYLTTLTFSAPKVVDGGTRNKTVYTSTQVPEQYEKVKGPGHVEHKGCSWSEFTPEQIYRFDTDGILPDGFIKLSVPKPFTPPDRFYGRKQHFPPLWQLTEEQEQYSLLHHHHTQWDIYKVVNHPEVVEYGTLNKTVNVPTVIAEPISALSVGTFRIEVHNLL